MEGIRGKVWGVSVFLLGVGLVLVVLAQHATAQRGTYACWGGCYNECILQTGKNPSQRMPCYWSCLGSCFASRPAASEYQSYCQFGCSLQQCIRYTSDGGEMESNSDYADRGKMESCLENCSNRICSSNT